MAIESLVRLWPFSMDKNKSGITVLQNGASAQDFRPEMTVDAQATTDPLNLERFCGLFEAQGEIDVEDQSDHFDGSSTCSVSPLFTGQVLSATHYYDRKTASTTPTLPQYALLGILSDARDRTASPADKQRNLLLSNTNEPWSAFICGSQGSGKSHTLSCLLENALLANSPAGVVQKASAGIIFHYDKFSGLSNGQICEAAYLCSSEDIEVRVLVAPTSEKRLKKQYRNLPGIPAEARKPKVVPFYLQQAQLSIDTIMTLMAVQDTGINAPLYINVIRQMLREMALDNQDKPGFSYDDFAFQLAHVQDTFTDHAKAPLELRLQLLRSVLLAGDQCQKTSAVYEDIWNPRPGTLTIVDLSDAFINENDACVLFSICLKLFMTGWQNAPRIIALDEAHKFLTATAEAQKLTDDLISVVRQQRHLNTRVIVATQEPTVSGEFLDLCNVSIVHRFTSPQWFNTLKNHLAAAHDDSRLFDTIVKLKTGQAVAFCPTAVIGADENLLDLVMTQNRYLKVSIRKRVSADGGKSITAVPQHALKEGVEGEDHNQDAVEVKRISNATLREIATRARDMSRPCNLAAAARVSPMTATTTTSPQSPGVSEQQECSSATTVLAGNTASESENLSRPNVPLSATAAIDCRDTTPSVSQNIKTCSSTEIAELIREKVKSEFAVPPPDPRKGMLAILRKIEKELGMPKYSLRKAHFSDGHENVCTKTLMRRAVKQHYQKHGIPASDINPKIRWLNK